jgi:hypothetical protein
MKKFALGLMFLALASPAFAGPTVTPAGPVGSVSVCGQTLSSAAVIHLWCRLGGANNRCNFRTANGTSGYTPSGSKTFVVDVLHVDASTGNAGSYAQLGYSDNDLGWSSAGTFTNGVFQSGQTEGGQIGLISTSSSPYANNSMDPNSIVCVNTVGFTMPNAKFLAMKGDGTNTFVAEVWGHEQ